MEFYNIFWHMFLVTLLEDQFCHESDKGWEKNCLSSLLFWKKNSINLVFQKNFTFLLLFYNDLLKFIIELTLSYYNQIILDKKKTLKNIYILCTYTGSLT